MANKQTPWLAIVPILLLVAAAGLLFSSDTFASCISSRTGQPATPGSFGALRLFGAYAGCTAEITRANFELVMIAAALLTTFFVFATWQTMRRAQTTDVEFAKVRQRAYVGVAGIELDAPNLAKADFEVPDAGNEPATFVPADFLRLTVSNFGLTPAKRVLVVANWAAMPLNRNFSYTFDYRDQITKDEIAAAGRPTIDPNHVYRVALPLSKLKPFRDAAAQTATIYIYGHIDYSDIFGRRWRRDFCYIHDARRGPVSPYFEHNDEYSIAADNDGVLT